MVNRPAIIKEIKKQRRLKTLKTEQDALDKVAKFITDEPSYRATIEISDLLPKTKHKIISNTRFKHPWFKGYTTNTIFVDIWGRMWNVSKGVIKKDIKTKLINDTYSISKLGGLMWKSKKGRTFICCYRTCKEDLEQQINPETFIG